MAVEVEVEAAAVVAASRNTCSKLNHRENTMDMQNTSAPPDVNGSERTLKESIHAMAAVIGVLQRREHALEDLVQEQLQLLQIAVKHADQRVTGLVENALPRLTQLSNQALTQTLEPAAERFNEKLANAEQAVQQATQRYVHAQHALETTATRRMWIASIALLVSGVLGLGAVAYSIGIIDEKRNELVQLRASIDYWERVARADLAPCGEDRLCATFEKNGPRYGNQRQYRAINLRAAPTAQ
ncbi:MULTISPECIES: hypothetical protein [Xanthomonas]|uniref:Relaxation protein n=1 Tax=Xanthomonas dyei TaxID=743699 RepID=A0ABZ0DEH9_9XANT|nr:hypothetical protein [Xanthomonas dyei]WOB28664.1 hypothetical protein NYR99_17360 [Xanthomonas dyei]WOB56287.1 hypothetical protein NYR95_17365 [Xanthomonas dyei]